MAGRRPPSHPPPESTAPYGDVDHALGTGHVRGYTLDVIEGPDSPRHQEMGAERCTIGAAPGCDLRIDDPTVSRFHCDIVVDGGRVRISDLGSRNGTYVDGTLVERAFLRSGSLVRLGQSVVRFQRIERSQPVALSSRTGFGLLVGRSAAMRATFALLERAAESHVKVLLEGETGTGKSVTARSIHLESARKSGPFIQVDCGAIPASLLESELFGHVKGAFTGALGHRVGAFEAAHGGTLFLDEIGELGLELQPKLLLALEQGGIHRVGEDRGQGRKVDVRIVTATNRDLRAAVNAGQFREDLYYRIAVVTIRIPPLRQRPEDLPDLVRTVLERQGRTAEEVAAFMTPELMMRLRSGAWPGNIRELVNYLERCLTFQSVQPIESMVVGSEAGHEAAGPTVHVDATLSFREARQQALEQVERFYLEELLRLHEGSVAQAARAAGIERTSFYRKMRQLGIAFETTRETMR